MIDKSIFEELFVLDMSANHRGSLARAREIIKEHSLIVSASNVRAAVVLPFLQRQSVRSADAKEPPPNSGAGEACHLFSREEYAGLMRFIRQCGCLPLSTPFDQETLGCCQEFDLPLIKICRTQSGDRQFLEKVAASGRAVIVSTSSMDLKELDDLVELFAGRSIPLCINYGVAGGPQEDCESELNRLDLLRKRYPEQTIGYSSFEHGDCQTSITIAYAKGSRVFERQIDIKTDGIESEKFVLLPDQTAQWFAAYKKAREFCGVAGLSGLTASPSSQEKGSKSGKLITVLTPCFNEEGNVEALYEAVKAVVAPRYRYEHLFIDNCSTDKTVENLRRLAAADPNVKVIVNMRNFGHVRSPYHALHQASGDAVIGIVADLQDPPELINQFLDYWEQGELLVVGVKTKSRENPIMYAARTVYYRLLNAMANVNLIEHFSGYALFDRSVVEELKKVSDNPPYIRGLISELGYQPRQIEYVQAQRKSGKTHLSFYDLFDFAMLGLTSHSIVPVRLATITGFFLAFCSFLVSLFYLIYKLVFWSSFSVGTAPLVIGMFFMFSIQLMFIGLLGEYVSATHQQVLKRPFVVEKERINFDRKD
jgi:polyisoprenyl-phosphate glycosyltransferase